MSGFGGGLFFAREDPIDAQVDDDQSAHEDNYEGPDKTVYTAGFADDESGDDEDIPYENPQLALSSSKRSPSASAEVATPAKELRVAGGKAAVPRKVVASGYDWEDRMILNMKQQGFTNVQIAQKLIAEGGTRYDPKSIGSRWLKMRRVRAQHDEGLLDDDLSDWHIGDDEKLNEAYKFVDRKFEDEIKRIYEKRWKHVAEQVALQMGQRKYSAKACEERFEANLNGTALLPIELDPDQEGRQRMRNERMEAARRRRAEAAAEEQRKEDEKNRAKNEKRAAQDEWDRQKAERMAQRVEERTERERTAREAKSIREAAKKDEKAIKAMLKTQLEWDRARTKIEKRLIQENISMARHMAKEIAKVQKRVQGGSVGGRSSTVGTGSAATTVATSSKATTPVAPKAPRSDIARLNARSVMTLDELDILCFQRGLKRKMPDENQPELVARLAAEDELLTVSQLKQMLKVTWRAENGTKDVLIQRLQQADAADSEKGKEGIKATDPEFIASYEGARGLHGMPNAPVAAAGAGQSNDAIEETDLFAVVGPEHAAPSTGVLNATDDAQDRDHTSDNQQQAAPTAVMVAPLSSDRDNEATSGFKGSMNPSME